MSSATQSGERSQKVQLPQGWSRVALEDVVHLLTGYPFESSKFTDAGVRLLRGSNVKRGVLDWGPDISVYWPKITSNLGRFLLDTGDVVIAMDGALVGRSYGMMSLHDLPCLLVQRVARLRSSRVEQSLLKFLVESGRFVQHVDTVKTHTAIPHISPADIRNFVVELPDDRDEQRAIAAALSDVDALIGALDRLIEKKRAIKLAAMQQLLTGRTRLAGFEVKRGARTTNIGAVPKDWAVQKLVEVSQIKTGPFGSSLHESDYVADGTPIITVEHLDEFGISHSAVPMVSDIDRKRLQAYSLVEGDIVFSRVGSVDRNALVRRAEAGWLFSGRLLRVRPNTSIFHAPFLSYQFHSEPFKQRVRSIAVGQTMASLNTVLLGSVEVFVPGLDEQVAIATIFTDMDAEIASLEQRRDKTKLIKQGMMQVLLTGKVRLV